MSTLFAVPSSSSRQYVWVKLMDWIERVGESCKRSSSSSSSLQALLPPPVNSTVYSFLPLQFDPFWQHYRRGKNLPSLYDPNQVLRFYLEESLADCSAEDDLSALLLQACRCNALPVVHKLIQLGADVNCTDNGVGATPLMYAAAEGLADMAVLLLHEGANLHAALSNGGNALTAAIKHKHRNVVEVLFAFGISLQDCYSVMCKQVHKHPMNFIVATTHQQSYEELLERRKKERMLSYAVEEDNDLLLELLFGLDESFRQLCRDLVDVHGNTLLHIACERCFDRTAVFLLLRCDMNIHAINDAGSSTLISAARGGCEYTAELLLDRGVNVELVDKSGMTALMHAGSLCTLTLAKMLVARGAVLKNPFAVTQTSTVTSLLA